MNVDGFHHVTAITADIDGNLDFYGRLLGLRLVWQGVNADDPEMRHIAYGDERGSPGSLVTFFDMPGVMRGRPGADPLRNLALLLMLVPTFSVSINGNLVLGAWLLMILMAGMYWSIIAEPVGVDGSDAILKAREATMPLGGLTR